MIPTSIVARCRCIMVAISILAVVYVGTDAVCRDHLKTLGLRVEDLVGHGKARNVPIYGRHDRLICVSSLFPLFTAWWGTSQRDTPRVDYSGHVLYRWQHGEDHRVFEVRSLLCQLALALFRLGAAATRCSPVSPSTSG